MGTVRQCAQRGGVVVDELVQRGPVLFVQEGGRRNLLVPPLGRGREHAHRAGVLVERPPRDRRAVQHRAFALGGVERGLQLVGDCEHGCPLALDDLGVAVRQIGRPTDDQREPHAPTDDGTSLHGQLASPGA